MDQWTVEYVDEMTRQVLEDSFMMRRAKPFKLAKQPGFDWDKATGMVVRAWIYAREHPTWMQEVPFDTTTERFAELLGLAIQKTTSTGATDSYPGISVEDFSRLHVDRQINERTLVETFAAWSLQGISV